MKVLSLLLLILIRTIPVYGQNLREIENNCKNEIDFQLCERAYKGLPLIISPPTLPITGPVSIKVVPYQGKYKQKSSHLKRIKRMNNWYSSEYDLID